MHVERRPFIGGNWKMNSDLASAVELAEAVVAALGPAGAAPRALEETVDAAVFPPFPYLQAVGRALGHSAVMLGGQDCSAEASGAFTGQVSADMLCDLGCRSVIIGHSERRHGLGEDDALLHQKLAIALESGLAAVLCVGETLSERDEGRAEGVVRAQLRGCFGTLTAETVERAVVAYEPVWAIGTGKVATTEQAQEVHAFIRGLLTKLFGAATSGKMRILYGGSMKPANAAELLAQKDIDGGLIGGASLESRSFVDLVKAAAAAK